MPHLLCLLFATLLALSHSVSAEPGGSLPTGTRIVSVVNAADQTTDIATLTIDTSTSPASYKLDLLEAPFVDKFLSMRPFRCIEIGSAMLCHLPYPYAKPNEIAPNKLINLEYDLLFLQKTATEYGIDAWNGRYYRLQLNNDGIDGVLQEVDLNVLAAPPEDGVVYPITPDMLHPADPTAHLFPRLIIR